MFQLIVTNFVFSLPKFGHTKWEPLPPPWIEFSIWWHTQTPSFLIERWVIVLVVSTMSVKLFFFLGKRRQGFSFNKMCSFTQTLMFRLQYSPPVFQLAADPPGISVPFNIIELNERHSFPRLFLKLAVFEWLYNGFWYNSVKKSVHLQSKLYSDPWTYCLHTLKNRQYLIISLREGISMQLILHRNLY